MRGKLLSNVKYDLKLALLKDKNYFRGNFKATFDLVQTNYEAFHIDFQGEEISGVKINGKEADVEFKDHRIRVKDNTLLKQNNEIEFRF